MIDLMNIVLRQHQDVVAVHNRYVAPIVDRCGLALATYSHFPAFEVWWQWELAKSIAQTARGSKLDFSEPPPEQMRAIATTARKLLSQMKKMHRYTTKGGAKEFPITFRDLALYSPFREGSDVVKGLRHLVELGEGYYESNRGSGRRVHGFEKQAIGGFASLYRWGFDRAPSSNEEGPAVRFICECYKAAYEHAGRSGDEPNQGRVSASLRKLITEMDRQDFVKPREMMTTAEIAALSQNE